MRSALVLVAVAACSDDPIAHSLENEGEVCLRASKQLASGDIYEVDEPVFIQYQTSDCLSGSCDVRRSGTCTVTRAGTSLTIASAASWQSESRADGCTADCGRISAVCETEPLAAGTYSFAFGTETLALSVPSTVVEAPCVRTR